ncbi:Ger(x)C family spore germination protein [Pseudalkalibacillus hwajinpoensis]|uniref:Ger(X)C family spore germination protein n=1 Tax=Guptibacillus hwajinpoensis TaxID=208199 RepID=A0A4U1MNF2_9BACL|nr:Ger(x)C family spore germination protein [Pseudalkalibacillus hwajinpoensis]TKD72142.1 Ger(x)C family spore germination protein [Pseudalkalibacillus hwajinpoensis]
MKRPILLILLSSLLLILSACWDSDEIEDLGIIMAIGLDYVDEQSARYSMTNQYVVPNNIPSTQGGGNQGSPFQNLTLDGNNFFEIIRKNSLESDRPPNYTHLKSMVVSEKLIEHEPINKIISFFLRDHEFRRTVPVFITKENVATILSVKPTKEMFPAVQIKELTQNIDRSLNVQDNLNFGDLSKHLSDRSSFVIPEISINQDRIHLAGAGIISNKDNKIAGWLTPEEVGGLKWIKDTVRGGLVTIDPEQSSEDQIVLEINKSQTKIEPVLKGDQLSIILSVNASLRLGEDWNIERNVFKPGWDKELKKNGEEIVKESIENVVSLAQEEFGLDFLEFSTWVRIKQPEYWKKHEKEWNSEFSKVPVIVNVDFTLTGYGTQDIN